MLTGKTLEVDIIPLVSSVYTPLEIDLLSDSFGGREVASFRRLCRRVSQAGKQRGPRERWFP